jgi:hypothetical protein
VEVLNNVKKREYKDVASGMPRSLLTCRRYRCGLRLKPPNFKAPTPLLLDDKTIAYTRFLRLSAYRALRDISGFWRSDAVLSLPGLKVIRWAE